MTKLTKFFSAALLSIVVFGAHAGLGRSDHDQQSFRTAEGEYLLVNPKGNAKAYDAMANTLQKTGYSVTASIAGIRTDTWCQIDIETVRLVTIQCYSPPSAIFDLVVRKRIWWPTEKEGDYAEVPGLVTELRQAHRRATKALNQRPTKALFVAPAF